MTAVEDGRPAERGGTAESGAEFAGSGRRPSGGSAATDGPDRTNERSADAAQTPRGRHAAPATSSETTPAPGAAAPGRGHSPFIGTWALVRHNLRLDRIQLPVWILAMGIGVWASVEALKSAYPTPEALATRGALLENPATILMTGPAFSVDNYTFGAALANELALYVFLPAAIMSVLLTVRHTRAEEESGRLELVRSLPVGRFAPPVASAITVALANVLVGAAVTAALLGAGQETAGSLAFGLATALTGLVFAAIATVFAQLTESARTARAMSMAAIAVAFLVRGFGDVINPTGSWLSWFSPFAWAQQTRLYVDLRWWPLAVSAVAAVGLYVLAVGLAQRRELGAGLRPPRRGPAAAARTLLSPSGLAARLLRGSALTWGTGVFFFAVAMGAIANQLESFLDSNPQLRDWINLTGADITSDFAATILQYLLLAAMIFGVSGVLRLKSEEESGRTEQMLVAGTSRYGYLGGWLATASVQTLLLILVAGLGSGLGVASGTGDSTWIGRMVLASLAFVPAISVVMALAVALHGVQPRLTGVAWAVVTWVSIVLFLGPVLGLPEWAMNTSPFTLTPQAPADDVTAAPLLALAGVALVLAVAGFVGFRRRDIAAR